MANQPQVNNSVSLMPMWNSWDLDYPFRGSSVFDQNFGLGLFDDILNPSYLFPYRPTGYVRPWRSLTPRESGLSSLSLRDDEFKVNLDVQQFRPDEITVKTVDNFIVVEGNHEERRDEHGFVRRSFSRRYLIPKNVDQDAIKSDLSSDGVLTISAPRMPAQSMASERLVKVVQTHVPAIATSQTKVVTGEPEKAMDE